MSPSLLAELMAAKQALAEIRTLAETCLCAGETCPSIVAAEDLLEILERRGV